MFVRPSAVAAVCIARRCVARRRRPLLLRAQAAAATAVAPPPCRLQSQSAAPSQAEAASDKPDEGGGGGAKKALPSGERTSLLQGLFMNEIEPRSLVYPELPDVEALDDLNKYAGLVDELLRNNVDAGALDQSGRAPDSALEALADAGVYRMKVPKEHGGLGLTHKHYARVCESLAGAGDLCVYAHASHTVDMCVEALAKYAPPQLRDKYLEGVMSGELKAAMCLQEESNGFDVGDMRTTVHTPSGRALDRHRFVSGTKAFVAGARNADLFIVFARLQPAIEAAAAAAGGGDFDFGLRHSAVTGGLVSAFVVDKRELTAADGKIVVGERRHVTGLRAFPTHDVTFDNCPVADDNVLGVDGQAYDLALELCQSNLYSFGAAVCGLIKRILGTLVSHCHDKIRFGLPMSEQSSVRTHISDVAVRLYELESLAYYVAGSLDESESDMTAENCVVLRSALDALRTTIFAALDVLGPDATTDKFDLARVLRDYASLSTILMSDDMAVAAIAMSGNIAWADRWSGDITLFRQGISNPWFQLKKAIKFARGFHNPKFRHYINEHLHPSLEGAARFTERTMARMEMALLSVVSTHGKDVENHQESLRRIATSVGHLLTMVAVCTRASRSYAVGLKQCDNELVLAQHVCTERASEVYSMMMEMTEDTAFEKEPKVSDVVRNRVAETVLQEKGYPCTSPLDRNW